MISRQSCIVCATALCLYALTSAAQAQFQPPPSAPYAYPSQGRWVPDPDDDMTALDPDDGDEAAPVPGARPVPGQARASGYDPRNDNDPNAYRPDPGIAPADPRGQVYGHYGDRAPDGTLRPPAGMDPMRPPAPVGGSAAPVPNPPTNIASLPADDQPEVGEPQELPPQFKRQIVDYVTKEPAGSIIIDTPSTYLYYVLGDGKAMRYGIGVGREGFTWSGVEKITRLAEWPDWHPPAEMIERQPYLPRFMAGGPGNPLGARALYLGKTVYRIHGTNQPSTIGKFVSSGCIRMLNEDVEDLYGRVKVGTRVVVRPGAGSAAAASAAR
jgi:lipoprotein-anchoring transpeptidase ErfK/SrfK